MIVATASAIGVCQFGLLFLGMKLGMPAGLSSLVIQLQVFFTIGLGDRIPRRPSASTQNAIGARDRDHRRVVLLAVHKMS